MGFREKGESPRKTPADQVPSASGRQRRVAGGCGKWGKAAQEEASAARARTASVAAT
uniref:Uncharacterized protein n=1 Tax=Arundo donax TaxID=35708 RepID=A0A0A8YER7_ARUDO